jgi:5,10-methylene-tetrahydrofolate dehydrogenase/methenyl tetrahydrofolate cyclohydrolase
MGIPDHTIFQVERFHEDEARVRDRIAELRDIPGLGILTFRPFGVEFNAGRDPERKQHAADIVARTLNALSPAQDVDGQGSTRYFHPATARTSVSLLNYGLQNRGGIEHPEQNTDLTDPKLNLAVIGEGPAVGGPAIEILRKEFGQDPVVITQEKNQEYLSDLWQFDGIIGAAGSPYATEMITPDRLERPVGSAWRPPNVLADAAFDRSPLDGTPQGNLHRGFSEYPEQLSNRLSVIYTPLGAIGAGTGVEILNATWNVLDMQQELAYA